MGVKKCRLKHRLRIRDAKTILHLDVTICFHADWVRRRFRKKKNALPNTISILKLKCYKTTTPITRDFTFHVI